MPLKRGYKHVQNFLKKKKMAGTAPHRMPQPSEAEVRLVYLAINQPWVGAKEMDELHKKRLKNKQNKRKNVLLCLQI